VSSRADRGGDAGVCAFRGVVAPAGSGPTATLAVAGVADPVVRVEERLTAQTHVVKDGGIVRRDFPVGSHSDARPWVLTDGSGAVVRADASLGDPAV
jgi:hypothetical protein